MVRVLIAFVVLAGLASPASAQVSTPAVITGPDGQRQFGPYKGPVSVTALCPSGDVVLGGGVMAGPLFRAISNSKPTTNFDGWRVHFYKYLQGGTFTVTVYASCVSPQ
jgi:hypothetical protein